MDKIKIEKFNNNYNEKKDKVINVNPETFISLNSLSKCQYCNMIFNSKENIPILFKCNHFFCKKCIETYFYEEGKGIKCPIDGIIAKSFDEVIILNKLIENNIYVQNSNPYINSSENINNNIIEENQTYNTNDNKETENNYINNNYCQIHKNQLLTHYVEDTRELICAYCAFNKLKNNPKIIIKEINEKLNDYINEVDNIIENNKKYVNSLQNLLNEIQINKENEENKVNDIYEQLIAYLINNRNICLNKIEDLFNENTKLISDKLDLFTQNIEKGEKIKEELINITNQNFEKLNIIFDKFNSFIRIIGDNSYYDLNINQYKFTHDDENKAIKYLNNFADLKCKKRLIKFNDNNSQLINYNNNIQNKTLTSENSQKDFSNFPTLNNLTNRTQFRTKKIFNNIFEDNDNTMDNINAALNKYITPTNYKKRNFEIENENTLKKNDNLSLLNKYNISSNKI